jgi:hypothetical protein
MPPHMAFLDSGLRHHFRSKQNESYIDEPQNRLPMKSKWFIYSTDKEATIKPVKVGLTLVNFK